VFLLSGILTIIGFSIPYIEWIKFKINNVPHLRAWPNDDRGAHCLPYLLIPSLGIGIWVVILAIRELLSKRLNGQANDDNSLDTGDN